MNFDFTHFKFRISMIKKHFRNLASKVPKNWEIKVQDAGTQVSYIKRWRYHIFVKEFVYCAENWQGIRDPYRYRKCKISFVLQLLVLWFYLVLCSDSVKKCPCLLCRKQNSNIAWFRILLNFTNIYNGLNNSLCLYFFRNAKIRKITICIQKTSSVFRKIVICIQKKICGIQKNVDWYSEKYLWHSEKYLWYSEKFLWYSEKSQSVLRKILIGIQKIPSVFRKICPVFRKVLKLSSEKSSVNRKVFLPVFRKIKMVIRKIMEIFRFCRIQILLNTVSHYLRSGIYFFSKLFQMNFWFPVEFLTAVCKFWWDNIWG